MHATKHYTKENDTNKWLARKEEKKATTTQQQHTLQMDDPKPKRQNPKERTNNEKQPN